MLKFKGEINVIITIFVTIINAFLLIFPQIVLPAARDGLMLWFNNILPSLLPFMIGSNILILLGGISIFCRIISPVTKFLFKLSGTAGFAVLIGLTSGYPMGAKTTADLLKNKEISLKEAQHLIYFCNNAGPIFIISVVGLSLFNNLHVGYTLLAGHIISALIIGIILRPKFVEEKKVNKGDFSNKSIGGIISEAVKNAMESMTFIGGLIIFFNVLFALFDNFVVINEPVLNGFFSGIIEITSGAKRLSEVEFSLFSLGTVAFILGFGGFSVHAQALHFINGTGLKTGSYILAKAAHGLLAVVVTLILWQYIIK